MTDTQTKKTMGVDPWEKRWMIFTIVMLVVFAASITIAGLALGIQLPTEEKRVDPGSLTDTGPFANPGLREVGPGEYEAYVVSQIWSFDPPEIEIPVGSKLTIYVSSVDVQHGFKIQDSNVNMQIVPGEVSKLSFTFDRVGEFPYICTEYCGVGHAAMFGIVRVVEAGGDS